MKNLLLAILVFATFSACSSPQKMTTVQDLDSVNFVGNKDILYSLPKTGLKLSVQVEEEYFEAGPYAAYAKEFLGIEVEKKESYTLHRIVNIELDDYIEADYSQNFVIKPGDQVTIDFLHLFNTGLILPFNETLLSSFVENKVINSRKPSNQFTSMAKSPYYSEIDKPVYRRVKRDSGYVTVPVMKSQLVQRSVKDKAEEIANFIFDIRKQRMSLITFENELIFEGKSLDAALQEMQRLEKEHVSLFVGKKYLRNYTKVFFFNPSSENETEPIVAFRFKEDKGVLESNDLSGRPIYMEFKKDEHIEKLSEFIKKTAAESMPEEEQKNMPDIPQIFFRMPAATAITLSDGRDVLYKDRKFIYQFGELIRIPSNALLKNNQLFFQFELEE